MKVVVSLVCLIGLEFASGAKKRAAVGRWDKVDFNCGEVKLVIVAESD